MDLQEHLEKKLEEWRELFEDEKEGRQDVFNMGRRGGYFSAYKEMLDFMKNNADIAVVRLSLPHEDVIELAIDKLMIIRGEHSTRVRNPIYCEERQLAKDVVKYVIKYVILSNEA